MFQVLRGEEFCVGWEYANGVNAVCSCAIPDDAFGRWMHLAAVFDGVFWTLYVDGVGQCSSAPCLMVHYDGDWLFGGRAEDAKHRLYADIKNIRLWHIALSPQKVAKLPSGAPPVNNGNILCFFRCKEREGRKVHDSVWVDGARLCGEVSGKAGWVGSHVDCEIEEELDFTTLNDRDGLAHPSSYSAHACVDRATLWRDLASLPREEMFKELEVAQETVARLYARSLIIQTIAQWPGEVLMSADAVGGTANICSLLKVLVDCSQTAAVELIRSKIPKLLNDTPETSRMPTSLLNECLELIEEVPAYIVRESTHPYIRQRTPSPRCVSVEGCTQYKILTDSRSTESGPESLVIAADVECRRVIARNSGSKPWSPLSINLPKFYFHYKDAHVGGWGYRIVIQYGYERFELGLALLEQLVGYCTQQKQVVPQPLRLFHSLVSAAMNSQSYHRRSLLSLISQLVSAPEEWPLRQIPNLVVLKPLKMALEKQHAREVIHGPTVMHSKCVQSLTELFLAVKKAEKVWLHIAMRGLIDHDVGVFYHVDLATKATSVQRLPKVDTNLDGRVMVWPESTQVAIRSSVTMVSGRWHYEVRKLTGRGALVAGIIRHEDCCVVGWNTMLCPSTCGVLNSFDAVDPQCDADTSRQPIGVDADIDAGSLTFTANGSILARCSFPKLDPEHPKRKKRNGRWSPFFWVAAKDGFVINFGTAPFAAEPSEGYHPVRPSQLSFNADLPFNQLQALLDTASCLLHNKQVPEYYSNSCDHFKGMKHRVGPQYVEVISADGVISNGLECKNTGTAFYSVKANVKVTKGRWYYEASLCTHGLMQIGWATERFTPKPIGGLGVGDDEHSWGIDLFRRQRWHQNYPGPVLMRKWQAGDVVGCLIDIDNSIVSFTLNGEPVQNTEGETNLFPNELASKLTDGVYPAASFRANNSVIFNFGGTPLVYLPPGYMPLGVPDTWLDRVDTYYSSTQKERSGSIDSCNSEDSFGSEEKVEVVRPEVVEKNWTLRKTQCFVSLLNALCKAQKKNIHQVALDRTMCTEIWSSHPLMTAECAEELARRLAVHKKFSRLVLTMIPLVNFEMAHRMLSTASTMVRTREVLLQSVSDDILRSVIKSTNGRPEAIRVTLNRRKAALHKQHPEQDTTGQSSLFAQTFELLGHHPPSIFKTNQRFWCVVFAGEGAEDVGGPYREHITEMCSELMSEGTPLFIPSPNNRAGVGSHRDCFVPNPSASLPVHLSMFAFVGRLMGGAIRSNEPLSLYLPPVVWKMIVGEKVGEDDIECFDLLCHQCIENLRTLHTNGVAEEMQDNKIFSSETFSTLLSDGSGCELTHGGNSECVTFDRLEEYGDLVANARLNEGKLQIASLRQGLFSVIPQYVLHFVSWQAIELKVCGRSDFTVKELKEYTTLDGLAQDDRRVAYLWTVLEEATAAERRAFLRFVAGRERLPVKLRIMPLFCKNEPDTYLPKAATCFFALELPEYSSLDVMRAKLLYAIHNCTDIDTDFRAREIDEDEAPQLMFDELRQEEHDITELEGESIGSAEEW